MQEVRFQKIRLPNELKNHLTHVYMQKDWDMIDASDHDGIINQSDYSDKEIKDAYRRGVISKIEKSGEIEYIVSTFDVRMECLIQCEPEIWDEIQGEDWEAIKKVMMDPENWLKKRIEQLDQGNGRQSVVKPLEKAEQFLRESDGHFFAIRCNCQAYIRGCDRDKLHSCIHFEEKEISINSPLDRGLCEEITLEEAVEALRKTDELGLVHTLGKNGMCNCCTCCCYNFINMGDYPIIDNVIKRPYRAHIDDSKCIGCEACTQRCMFEALVLSNGVMQVDTHKCLGCGLCRTKCPVDAINMIEITN